MSSDNGCTHRWVMYHPPTTDGWVQESCADECEVTLNWHRAWGDS